ncbi:MAG: polysaccharide biosynthesis C-terminal domain-containing protein, partial [Oscillospiraceae bacterium]|nr:polysaccharide biosynthesis C-terminal domain-containing protein [Oscillospiraceae bacterium]
YMTTTVINFFFLAKYLDLRPSFVGTFIKPLVASVICCFGAYGGYRGAALILGASSRMGNLLATFAGILCAGLIYLVLVLLFRLIGEDEVKMLPKGAKIYSVLKKAKLMK